MRRSPSTRAGKFVRKEIHHVRGGRHGARSSKQAIAIGLSKARRSGVKVPAPRRSSAGARRKARRDFSRGQRRHERSARRQGAVRGALRREPRSSVSRRALSAQTRRAARPLRGRPRAGSARCWTCSRKAAAAAGSARATCLESRFVEGACDDRNMRDLRQSIRQGVRGAPRRRAARFRQLRMRHPSARAELRALPMPGDRARGRAGGQDLLLRALREERREEPGARPGLTARCHCTTS